MHPSRHRNGSKKIPNVKLRPVAPIPSGKRSSTAEPLLEFDPERDGGFVDEESVNVSSGLRPFQGIVICCTGQLDKKAIFGRVEQLGGAYQVDLTEHVTHLIADAAGSSKYNYAVKVGLPVMSPAWIYDAHERYVQHAEDFTVEDTIEGYCLPCFGGLRISVSGENLLENRHKMARLMHKQGGTYMKDLTDNVTHLLIAGSAEDMNDEDVMSSKVLWALDTNKARQRQRLIRNRRIQQRLAQTEEEPLPDIHIVWAEWFWDCVQSNGRQPESAYSTEHPRPVPKPLQAAPMSTPSFALATSSTQYLGKDDDDMHEIEPVLKRAEAKRGSNLWRKVIDRRPAVVSGDVTMRQRSRDAGLSSASSSKASRIIVSRSTSDVSEDSLSLEQDSYLARVQQSRILNIEEGTEPGPAKPFSHVVASRTPKEVAPAIFSQTTFLILNEKPGSQDSIFIGIVEARGGMIIRSSEPSAMEDVDFILIRIADSSEKLISSALPPLLMAKMRTECWIEQCCYEGVIVPANQHISFQPLRSTTLIDEAADIEVALSGFPDNEALYLTRFCAAMGLRKTDGFSQKTTTHLICPSRTGLKCKMALKWKIPVVDLSWLQSLLKPEAIPISSHIADITNDSSPSDEPVQIPKTPRKRTLSETTEISDLRTSPVKNEQLVGVSTSKSGVLEQRSNPAAGRIKSAIPSSQSPSPLKSPVADVVRQQLASILDDNEDQQSGESGEPPKTRSASIISNLSAGGPRKKARPKPVARYNTIAGDAINNATSRTGSFSSTSSMDSKGKRRGLTLKTYASLDDDNPMRPPVSSRENEFTQAQLMMMDDDSMRVTYDDPHQRAARRQLMALVNHHDTEGEETPALEPKSIQLSGSELTSDNIPQTPMRRRSTRMAGF